jgi:hypothetical protein
MYLYFSLLSKVLIFVFFLYIFGYYIFNCFFATKIKNLNPSLLSIFIGVFFSILSFSLLKSGFKTINILFIPLITFLIYEYKIISFSKYHFTFSKIDFFKGILPIFIFVIIIFSFQFFNYYDFESTNFKRLFLDNYTYASIVSNLTDFGSENFDYSLNSLVPHFKKELIPYRYADLWLASLFMYLFKTKDIEAFYLCSIPVIISIIMYSFYTLIGDNIKSFVKYLLVIILIFSSIFFIPFLNPGDELKYISETSVIGIFKQKTALSALFFLMGIYLYRIEYKLSIVILFSIPILYVSYLPSIWGGLLFFLSLKILFLLFKKRNPSNEIKLIFLFIFTIIIYYFFYKQNASALAGLYKDSSYKIPIINRLPGINANLDIITNLKSIIITFFTKSISSIFSYLFGALQNIFIGLIFFLPHFIFLFKKIKNTKTEFFITMIFLLFGLFGLILRDGTIDNFQFFTNVLVFLNILLSLVYIINFSFYSKKHHFIYLSSIVCFCVFPIISFHLKSSFKDKDDQHFNLKVSSFLSKDDKNIILCIVNKNDFDLNYYSAIGRNILFPLKQLDYNVNFAIGNPLDYDNKREWKQEFNSKFNPMTILKIDINKDVQKSLISKLKLKYYLLYPGVKEPDFFKKYPNRKQLRNNSGYFFVKLF